MTDGFAMVSATEDSDPNRSKIAAIPRKSRLPLEGCAQVA
jgi:hypothetical protein